MTRREKGNGKPSILGVLRVWLYDFDTLNNDEVIARLHELQITLVFLSLRDEWLTQLSAKLDDFIRVAHSRNIEVHAMTLEDPSFTLTDNHGRAQQLIDRIVQYCNGAGIAPFDGIHIDTEPHALPEWTEANWQVNENLMRQYVELLRKVEEQIAAGGLPPSPVSDEPFQFSAAVAWWYNEQATNGNLPSGRATLLATHLNFLVPMVYDGIGASAQDIIPRIDDEIRTVPTMVGVDANNFPNFRALIDTVKTIDTRYLIQNFTRNYKRVCIFNYRRLIDLA